MLPLPPKGRRSVSSFYRSADNALSIRPMLPDFFKPASSSENLASRANRITGEPELAQAAWPN